MPHYVCPVHNDEVVFTSDSDAEATRGKRLSFLPGFEKMPRECRKCGKFYYRYECIEKED